MNRAEFIKVYQFAKDVARSYGGGPMFDRAKEIAVLIEQNVGQLDSMPAEFWTDGGGF